MVPRLLDHLVGSHEERGWNCEIEHVCRLQIHQQLELGFKIDGKLIRSRLSETGTELPARPLRPITLPTLGRRQRSDECGQLPTLSVAQALLPCWHHVRAADPPV